MEQGTSIFNKLWDEEDVKDIIAKKADVEAYIEKVA
jgi:hypothetical protein